MAYDIIYSEGCENGGTGFTDTAQRFDYLSGGSFPSSFNASGGPFGGPYLGLGTVTGAQDHWVWKTVTDTPQSTAFISLWMSLESGSGEVISLIEGMFAFGAEHVTCVIDSDNLGYTVRRGGASGTIIGTGDVTIPDSVWFHFEMRAVIHDTLGEVQVRHNGVQVVNITGADTRTGQTGGVDGFMIRGNGGSGQGMNLAHIIMQGASGNWSGRHRTRSYLVNASSTETDWTSVSASSNHANVDDTTPDEDATYNWSGSSGQRDRYGFADPAFEGDAMGIVARSLMKMEDPGTALVKIGIRSEGATEDLSTGQVARFTGYGALHHAVMLNPDDGLAWQATDLDSAEIVIESA